MSARAPLAWSEPEGWPADAGRDRLIGDWHIWQRSGGHRTSTDDVLTAWFAARGDAVAPPQSYCDLGCGIGSVLLMVAHKLRPRRCVGVEAQPQSVLMARRAVRELPPDAPPITVEHSDFRDFSGGAFDLVTGSPPYFPLGTGSLPADPQRRACRFEARGGVEAYCETAARCVARDGRFVFVFQTTWDARVLDAIEAAGLSLWARHDAKMREDRDAPFLTVYEARPRTNPGVVEGSSFAIRTATGDISAAYGRARRDLGVDASSPSPSSEHACIED